MYVYTYVYICIYLVVRTCAFHAWHMVDSVLSATGVSDPALLSVTRLVGPVLFCSLSCSSAWPSATGEPNGFEKLRAP